MNKLMDDQIRKHKNMNQLMDDMIKYKTFLNTRKLINFEVTSVRILSGIGRFNNFWRLIIQNELKTVDRLRLMHLQYFSPNLLRGSLPMPKNIRSQQQTWVSSKVLKLFQNWGSNLNTDPFSRGSRLFSAFS